MSSERPKLLMVDDPVASRDTPAARELQNQATEPQPHPLPSELEAFASAPSIPVQATPSPARYSDEPRKAVFGRLPRSLTRRLERALVDLRDNYDGLTQEQLLAALLDEHVDPTDVERMTALDQTVKAYRQRL